MLLDGVQKLLARITETRASRLDADVSSRMPGTTTQRDRIDVAISSRQADAGLTTTHRDRIDAAISSRATLNDIMLYGFKVPYPSNTIQAAADTEETWNSTEQVFKSFRIKYEGTVRLKADLKSTDSDYSTTVYFRLADDTVLTSFSTTSTTYVSESADVEIPEGAEIKVSLRSANGDFNTAHMKNIRICFDFITNDATVLQD